MHNAAVLNLCVKLMERLFLSTVTLRKTNTSVTEGHNMDGPGVVFRYQQQLDAVSDI